MEHWQRRDQEPNRHVPHGWHLAVPLMFDGHRLDISIKLEWTSGEIDSVTFEEYSVADCILKTAGAFSKSLKSLLIYEVW